MSQAIWKFPLEIVDEQEIDMPIGAKIITVKNQNKKPCLWAICNVDSQYEKRKFKIYGTGHQHNLIEGDYIGSVQIYHDMPNNSLMQFVWHVFEI